MSERIWRERLRLGLTCDEVAEALGVSVAVVAAWECGAIEPTASCLKDLSQLFGCSLDWLLGLASDGEHGVDRLGNGSFSAKETVSLQAAE